MGAGARRIAAELARTSAQRSVRRPGEEAEGYERLIKEFGYTQAVLATSVGKSRSHVANLLRLNKLPDEVKEMVNEGVISMGHARCLIGVPDAVEVAKKIVANDLNVRQAEELTKKRMEPKDSSQSNSPKPEISDDFIKCSIAEFQ